MKKIILLTTALLFGLTSNAHSKDSIWLVISTLNNPFFITLKEGAEAKAKELGYDLVVLDSNNDPAKEISNVEDLLSKNIKILLINPTDSDAVSSSIRAANRKGVPVITLDRSASNGKVLAHITSHNIQGGILAGNFIAEKINNSGKIMELQGVPGTSAARDRGEGFYQALKNFPDIKIITSQTANFDRTQGLNVMENILQAQPEIDAVFAHNDEMALGAIKAIQASNRDILVVGFDGTDDAITAVNKGLLLATVAQQAEVIGAIGIETAVKFLKGETVESYIPIPLQLITK